MEDGMRLKKLGLLGMLGLVIAGLVKCGPSPAASTTARGPIPISDGKIILARDCAADQNGTTRAIATQGLHESGELLVWQVIKDGCNSQPTVRVTGFRKDSSSGTPVPYEPVQCLSDSVTLTGSSDWIVCRLKPEPDLDGCYKYRVEVQVGGNKTCLDPDLDVHKGGTKDHGSPNPSPSANCKHNVQEKCPD
jgi:hypothetical protein